MMHAALGWPYRGRRVEQGTVVYIACEGERGLAARNAAFRQSRLTENDDPPFYLLTTRLDLPGQVDQLISDIADQIPPTPCGAIVLDTLNRSIRGSESRDEDMSTYVAAADALRQRFKCAVIIIHHCGINDSRPRGHTSLTGAVDAQLAVKRSAADKIIVTLEWMKDGPEGDEIASRLDTVQVGTDDNELPIASCIIEPAQHIQGKTKPAKKLSSHDAITLDALKKAIGAHGERAPTHHYVPSAATVISVDLWRRFYLAGTSTDGQNEDTRRKAWRRSRDRLIAEQFVCMHDEMVWIP
jgi:AAA domain